MTDAAAHGHSHAHEHEHAHAHVHAEPQAGADSGQNRVTTRGKQGFALIEASAGGRLVSILLPLAALWAGVFWALH